MFLLMSYVDPIRKKKRRRPFSKRIAFPTLTVGIVQKIVKSPNVKVGYQWSQIGRHTNVPDVLKCRYYKTISKY